MRLIKMLGLAAIAALGLMAFVGASSAMAESTLLCQKPTTNPAPNATECEPTKHVHFLSVVEKEGKHVDGKGKLVAGSTTVECELLVLGDVQEPFLPGLVNPEKPELGYNPVKIAAKLTYTNCNNFCTVTTPGGASEIPGTIDVLRLGTEELADVTGLGFEVKLNCAGLFKCDYNSEKLVGHGLPLNNKIGGLPHTTYTNASVNLTSQLEGLTCPSTGALTALLESLTNFYLRA